MKIKSAFRNTFRVIAFMLLGHLLTASVQAQALKPNVLTNPQVNLPKVQLGVAGIDDIDKEVLAIMQANGISGASLAIIWNTRLLYAQGYTWAIQGTPPVQPTTYFRQASVGKLITAMATMQLIAEGKLALGTTMQSVLNLQTPPADPRFNDITVQDLLEMTSGLDPNLDISDATIAQALHKSLPIAPNDIATYAAGEKLPGPPGNKVAHSYNNSDYVFLGYVVAKLRGAKSFADAIGAPLLAPLNITRIRASRSLLSQQPPDEASYDSAGQTGKSVMSPNQPVVPAGYGDYNLDNMQGAGGLSAAATDMARILATMNVNDNNPIFKHGFYNNLVGNMLSYAYSAFHDPEFPKGSWGMYGLDAFGGAPHYYGLKGGQLPTSQNAIYFEKSGFGYVINWNGALPNKGWYPQFTNVLTAAKKHEWGNVDLFPTYGMPALPGSQMLISEIIETPKPPSAVLALTPPSVIKSLASP
ncbi:MAG: serine hydrolase domain-containing protein [Xanthobacteraceae bacterium]